MNPTHFSPNQKRRSRRRASVIVETALCLTLVILPTTLGILQYGVVMTASNQIEQISREGARFAAVHCLEPTYDGDENQSNPPSLRYYLKNNVIKNKTTILWGDLDGPVRTPSNSSTTTVVDGFIQTIPSTLAGRVAGQSVSVKVCYPMKRKIFVGNIVPNIGVLDNDYVATSTFVTE